MVTANVPAVEAVEKAVMVDLDPDVVNLCRQYLPNHHQGSFEDQRTMLIHQDARGFLLETNDLFDVMIMDLVDPLDPIDQVDSGGSGGPKVDSWTIVPDNSITLNVFAFLYSSRQVGTTGKKLYSN